MRQRGVSHAAIFGSVARGEATPASDIDVLVELAPDLEATVFDYVGIKEYIASLFDRPVDVVNAAGLKAHVRRQAIGDVVYAF